MSKRLDSLDDEMRRLYAEGCSTREIAKQLKCSKATIGMRLRQQGVELRYPKPVGLDRKELRLLRWQMTELLKQTQSNML